MGARGRQLSATLIRWPRQEWPRLRLALLAFAVVIVVVAVLGPLPAWLTRHPSHGLTAAERLKAVNDVRTTLVQALGGLALLGGLFFTARTFRINAEEKLTDRYTSAVAQLGSDKLDVRLGGIYALERLMVDSPRDHPTIVEVLAAFLREHATAPTEVANRARRARSTRWRAVWRPPRPSQQIDPPAPMPADAAAAARVIARRPPGRNEPGRLDLHSCHLEGADLRGADLVDADLTEAVLVEADLTYAILTDADLVEAELTYAILIGADLTGTLLYDANLTGTLLFDADLTRVVGLTAEQLRAAQTDETTRVPDNLAENG
jgi:hypothetical protein